MNLVILLVVGGVFGLVGQHCNAHRWTTRHFLERHRWYYGRLFGRFHNHAPDRWRANYERKLRYPFSYRIISGCCCTLGYRQHVPSRTSALDGLQHGNSHRKIHSHHWRFLVIRKNAETSNGVMGDDGDKALLMFPLSNGEGLVRQLGSLFCNCLGCSVIHAMQRRFAFRLPPKGGELY